ncbi:MAG: hypothetical protein JW952_00865 [Candidatus Eisenbacteria bacterium]|nr:hypothetical protein [Candidatus Eisenbacteria bacterium]
MRCEGIIRLLFVCVFSVLTLLALSGTIGAVSATPGSPDEPTPVTPPPPDGSLSGDALILLETVSIVGSTVVL